MAVKFLSRKSYLVEFKKHTTGADIADEIQYCVETAQKEDEFLHLKIIVRLTARSFYLYFDR